VPVEREEGSEIVKIVVFGPDYRVGAWEGDRVIDLTRGFARYQREKHGAADAETQAAGQVPSDLAAFIEGGEAVIERAQQVIEHVGKDEPGTGADAVVLRQADVRLHAPWPRRARVCCFGGNFADHLAGAATGRTGKLVTPAEAYQTARAAPPWGFWKTTDLVKGPEDEIIYPARTARFDYEGEVAIILGKRGKDLAADRALDLVWGVSLLNDWSIRDSSEPARIVSFNLAKNFDGSTSLGPCIVVNELDPTDIDVETRINGELRQQFNTRDMVYSWGEFMEYLSRDLSFVPTDVLSSGTAKGTAMDATRRDPDGKVPNTLFLKPGDVVEVSSPQIGMLRNRVVAK
jgi:2-keto-4-pentenoate hydratase/2-oxohepta-3-ene-1,7-dioic acid hydratase in catechol pathway